ncbi:YihY/virulence factor BrkB family protein [Kiritimatiellaeota bacterium B1221]|nr:YihY/virulence factor BrkB family protein [Kiritimatiellaeota bacterium B1221]
MVAQTYLTACRDAVIKFFQDRSWRMAASITFYLLFMIGPMLALQLRLAEFLVGEDEYKDQIVTLFTHVVGEEGGEAVEDLLDEFSLPASGILQIGIGIWMMFFGGGNAMGQLRESLRHIWGVDESDNFRSDWKKPLVDAAFVLGFSLFLIASVIIHSVLAYAEKEVDGGMMATYIVGGLLYLLISGVLLTGVFAFIYRVLPGKDYGMKQVLVGSATTAVLFIIARQIMIFWIAHAKISSTYGSVAFFVVLMFWIYTSCQLVLFGGTFTHQLAEGESA